MVTIRANATVSPDGKLTVETVQVPSGIPPGNHEVVVQISKRSKRKRKTPIEFLVIDAGPWPEGLSLRREDMYDEWGR